MAYLGYFPDGFLDQDYFDLSYFPNYGYVPYVASESLEAKRKDIIFDVELIHQFDIEWISERFKIDGKSVVFEVDKPFKFKFEKCSVSESVEIKRETLLDSELVYKIKVKDNDTRFKADLKDNKFDIIKPCKFKFEKELIT